MPWKHVLASDKGMITNVPSTLLPEGASPYVKGVYIKNGEVNSDFGYTPFPNPTTTATNFLHGSVMKMHQFTQTTGASTLVALTTTNSYKYNTTSKTWDCITLGTTVTDCESAWTAKANVTATADTSIKLRDSKSAKLVIADAFTTGIAATVDFGAMDLHSYTALHFWIYSTAALTAGDYQIGISDTTALGGTPTYFFIPAVAANTWTPCCVSGTFTGLVAIISTGLKVVTDKGAATIYVDDVMAVIPFTGSTLNRFSIDAYQDTLLVTNGIDQPQKWTGSGNFANLTTTLNVGSLTTSEIVFVFRDHVLFMNNTENAADAPLRVTWGNIGALQDYVYGTAGYQDLTDDNSWIVAVGAVNEDEFLIYKERSIVKGVWVGGQTPFRFYTLTSGEGALSKEGLAVIQGIHVVFGSSNIYTIDSGTGIIYTSYNASARRVPVEDSNRDYIYSRVSYTYASTIFMIYVEKDDELQVWIPTAGTYPDETWCADTNKKIWYRKARAMTGWGTYTSQSALTIADLVGTIGEQNFRFGDTISKAQSPITMIGDVNGKVYQINKTTLNDNGVAVENEFQTPDFVIPDGKDFQNKFLRVTQLLIEAKGQKITPTFSTDGGNSWSSMDGAITLNGGYQIYQSDFETVCRRIRFKLYNNDVSSGFAFRYYGFYWLPRSGRK